LFTKVKVFLDTNVLLKGFAAFKKGQTLPAYLVDPNAKRYTFEKCIYEAYMAFRGVGGKKPDEGRGDWAQRYLRDVSDPSPVGKLMSQIHGDSKALAFFWTNQILEAEWSIGEWEGILENFPEEKKAGAEYTEIANHVTSLRQLSLERRNFENLCDTFRSFLREHSIHLLPYYTIFDIKRVRYIDGDLGIPVNASNLDSFVRDTILPSEDFEVVLAAVSLPADLFVTDDIRLITCATSLGLNFRLSPNSFCTSDEYSAKMEQDIMVPETWTG
jgi:hypothetical protein